MTVIVVLTCCCVQNFIKIGSRVQPPDVHNCWMSSASLLGNGRCHGNRIMVDISGTWWDATRLQPSSVPIGPLLGELWYFQYFLTWRPSAILNFKNFNIWLCDRHCGPSSFDWISPSLDCNLLWNSLAVSCLPVTVRSIMSDTVAHVTHFLCLETVKEVTYTEPEFWSLFNSLFLI